MILPQWLEVDRLPPAGLTLEGSLPVARCQRLAPLLIFSHADENDNRVDARLQCQADASGRPRLWGELDVRLRLQCQRCLEPMPWVRRVACQLRLLAAEPPAQDPQAQEEYALLQQGRLPLWQVLEDEVLLALPFSPRHEPACPTVAVPQPEPASPAHSPFAALARWRPST